jgi:hypothetical protein
MIVVVMIGIVAVMSATAWNRLTWSIQAKGAIEEFRDAILLARSDAITRKRNSGIIIDVSAMRYLRFIDSSSLGEADGRYQTGEVILRGWTKFPERLVALDFTSSISPDPLPRPCRSAASTPIAPTEAPGSYSIVFRPDGRAWATLQAKLGVHSFPTDTFRLNVLPPTGLVTLEN